MDNFPKSNVLHLINGLIKNTPDLKNNKLIFTTSTGTIVGEMFSLDEISNLEKNISNETLVVYMSHLAMKTYNKGSENKEKINFSDCIFLKNVTILNGRCNINLESYMLFVDSITGFSIGNL